MLDSESKNSTARIKVETSWEKQKIYLLIQSYYFRIKANAKFINSIKRKV